VRRCTGLVEIRLEELEVLLLLREFRDGVEEKMVIGRLEKLNPLWVKRKAAITVSEAIRLLEKRGFIQRVGNWVKITQDGKSAIAR